MIFRTLFYLTVVLLAVSCFKKFQFVKVPELEIYRTFIQDLSKDKLGVKGTNLYFVDDIENKKEDEVTLATCTRYDFKILGDNYIEINKKSWQKLNEEQRVLLVSHELLHCDCDMEHNDTILNDGCPSSISHSHAPDLYCIKAHFVRYFDEISLGCKE